MPLYDPQRINFSSEPMSVLGLLKRIKNLELNLYRDDYGGSRQWSDTKMSRFIESILLKIPLPPLYFDASEGDHRWKVIDGIYRLKSLNEFILLKSLVITRLLLLEDLNGKSFDDLDIHLQRFIEKCVMRIYVIPPNTPEIIVRDIYDRINPKY